MTDQGETRTVRVRLTLPAGTEVPAVARLRVRIEDVSAADRPSRAIAEESVPIESSGGEVTIPVPAGLIDPGASYSAFLHLDTTGSDTIEVGDFVSPAVHPVLTQGAPDEVVAKMVRVGGAPAPKPKPHGGAG